MANETSKTLRITLVKSPIGYPQRQKATVRALGLRRMRHTVTHADTAVIRGMIAKVSHLVKVEEGEG
ncbi:MAG: 50S ribosomal protein L30 [Anaerolineales bacterium]